MQPSADLNHTANTIERELKTYGFIINRIRLTDLLIDYFNDKELVKLREGPEDKRINRLMDTGNKLRHTHKNGDEVAVLGLGGIREFRNYRDDGSDKIAHIIISLKNPEEVKLLRRIYDEAFFLIAAYAPENVRQQRLASKIARSHGKYDESDFMEKAKELIDRDRKESWTTLGQNVENTFAKADVFVDVRHNEELELQIQRFIRVIFGYPFHTPTKDEYSLFLAEAVSRRSADLSRQVGAVISNEANDILATGCNDVPQKGGGTVWETLERNFTEDNRDFKRGYDSTARMKFQVVEEFIERLKDLGWLSEDKRSKSPSALAEEILYTENNKSSVLEGTRITSILEFGRVVHAEMHAITDAAKRGISVKDAILYCTTFPCHMCARHIIAAGIKRVVYIQPYPKSLAKELHSETIHLEDDNGCAQQTVVFEPFVGVAPRRYMEFFDAPLRKDERGYAIDWSRTDANPKFIPPANFDELEAQALVIFDDAE